MAEIHINQSIIKESSQIYEQDMDEIQRRDIPNPIQLETKANNQYPSKNTNKHNYSQYVCTKYNSCLKSLCNHSSNKNQLLFEVPQELLDFDEANYQKELQIYPTSQNRTGICLHNDKIQYMDQYIKQELNKFHKSEHQKKALKEKEKEQRKAKLDKINDQAKRRLKNNMRRKSLQKQEKQIKKPEWGHHVVQERVQSQYPQNLQKWVQKPQRKPKQKIQLKNIDQRITEYHQKEQQSKQKQKRASQCKHSHINKAKDQAEIQAQIQKDAYEILAQKRRKEMKEKNRRKQIKQKIREISRQSREDLKKYKKKSVDPTIQFVVDVPTSDNQKKNKQSSRKIPTEEGLVAKQQRKQTINSNLSKMKAYSEKLRETQKSKKSLKSEQQIKTPLVQDQERSHQQNNSELLNNSKFFIWDVPVYHQDLQKLEEDYYPISESQKPCMKSFRDEVNDYMQQKLHEKYQQDIKMKKEEHFMERVQQKKKAYLESYDSENNKDNQFLGHQQPFWDEDQLFRLAPLNNFEQY